MSLRGQQLVLGRSKPAGTDRLVLLLLSDAAGADYTFRLAITELAADAALNECEAARVVFRLWQHTHLDYSPTKGLWRLVAENKRAGSPRLDPLTGQLETTPPEPLATALTPATEKLTGLVAETHSDQRTATQVVFDAWQHARVEHAKSTGATARTLKLTRDRLRLIEAALQTFPLQEVVDAVQGWRNSPFHCGANPQGKIYNDLELLLRDTGKIEQFRDLNRNLDGHADRSVGNFDDLEQGAIQL